MTTLLDQFENHIYNEWKIHVDEICEFNLNQPLVKFSAMNGLLSVNFDPKVGRFVFLRCFVDSVLIIFLKYFLIQL
jgi:hypothetical protein